MKHDLKRMAFLVFGYADRKDESGKMEKWLVHAKKADFNKLGEIFGISPVIARIIRNRNIIEEEEYREYLNCDMNQLYAPAKLKDMKKAANVIIDAIRNDEKIRVIGDYDIDGVCSGYILTDGLECFGAKVDFDVPERIADGYGLNERLIKKSYDEGINLIVTCDNGIAASKQIEYAKQLGLKVVVTDHHEVPFEMEEGQKKYKVPAADAVVDQKQPDCGYPFKELCGAGIAYKLLEELYDEMSLPQDGKAGFMEKYLTFTAVATIGDIVPLLGENRTIVKNGLGNIKKIDNYGMRALLEVNELLEKNINSYHISFVIGPCINAGGRLDTAKKVFMLFRSKSYDEAITRAAELKQLNEERKSMTVSNTKRAVELIEKNEKMLRDRVLVVYLEDCHESLAGIIAGRLRELYHKPTLVFTDCEGGIKGSGRSVEGYSMFEELTLANDKFGKESKNGEKLFDKFGGHKMAAGVSMSKERLDILTELLNSSENLNDEVLTRKVWIDVALPAEYLSEELINQLELLEPFGMANEKPVFAEKSIRIERIRILGKNRNVIALNIRNQSDFMIEAVCFEEEDIFLGYLTEKFGREEVDSLLAGRKNNISINIVYYPEVNEYNGYRNIRVVIKRYS